MSSSSSSSPSSYSATAEDLEWLYDFTLTFLRSPLWLVPLQDFIDHHCLVFGGGGGSGAATAPSGDDEENPLEYTTIHMQYQQLMETLLQENLEAIGVSEADFVRAVERGVQSAHPTTQQICAQILTVEDFPAFKRLMQKRNVELEMEVIRAIGANGDASATPVHSSVTSTSASSGKARLTSTAAPDDDDDEELRRALEASLAEPELLSSIVEREQAELAHAIALSLALQAEEVRKAEAAVAEASSTAITHERGEGASSAGASAETATAAAPATTGESATTSTASPVLALITSSLSSSSTTALAPAPESGAISARPVVATQRPSTTASSLPPRASLSLSANSTTGGSVSLRPVVVRGSGSAGAAPAHDQNLAELRAQLSQNMDAAKSVLEKTTAVREAAQAKVQQHVPSQSKQVDETELKRRQELMRQQRDLLLQKKRKEGEEKLKQFNQETNAAAAVAAAAAAAASASRSSSQERKTVETSEADRKEAQRQAMREALLVRLKKEMESTEHRRAVHRSMCDAAALAEQLSKLAELQSAVLATPSSSTAAPDARGSQAEADLAALQQRLAQILLNR